MLRFDAFQRQDFRPETGSRVTMQPFDQRQVNFMNRSLLAAAMALAVTCSTPARAHVDIGIGIGIPGFNLGVPGVVVAPPAYYPPVEYVAPPPPPVVVVPPRPVYTPYYGWAYPRYDHDDDHWRDRPHWRGHKWRHGDDDDQGD